MQLVKNDSQSSIVNPIFKKISRFVISAASLMTGILFAILIQAVISSFYDNL